MCPLPGSKFACRNGNSWRCACRFSRILERCASPGERLQYLITRLPIDQRKIRFYMAIAIVLPFPAQRMIDVFCRERSIGREKR